METVDFGDANRPKTCIEIDFPILPINQVAIIEGNAGKPIYQMSKWWARRRSSVFRAMLIGAAAKAPADPSLAAKSVWDAYYANHAKKGAFSHLKVADIFMGGGTTLVEGSRLGMRMFGNDLNPVAWFVVKQELANVDLDAVKRLLADVEAEVRPQIIPFYACDGPGCEKGVWIHALTGRVMGADFDPLTLLPHERKDYSYNGPELIYTFWAKHAPCQTTGCGHRTPIMSTPVVAIKTLSVRYWEHACERCGAEFQVEDAPCRIAPDVPLYVATSEHPFVVLDSRGGVACPRCGDRVIVRLGNGRNKKVDLTLLVHPDWLTGSAQANDAGLAYGGSQHDDAASTTAWNAERARHIRLLEVRGILPETVTCPETGVSFSTGRKGGTVPKKSTFACGLCGTNQDVKTATAASAKGGQIAGYAFQGFSANLATTKAPYNGRFFGTFSAAQARQYSAAVAEWEQRKDSDLAEFWPRSEVPYGFMTAVANGDIRANYGFTHWSTMFNARQMLVLTQLLKSILSIGDHAWDVREYVLGAFQQYLRNQNMFCFWDISRDCLAPHMSNNNYHPKSNLVENGVFAKLGRGNWQSCAEGILDGEAWARNPWDVVSVEHLAQTYPALASNFSGKSAKVYPGDPVKRASIFDGSSTDLAQYATSSIDLVITDPPFGGLLHYSELADFFYVWLRLALRTRYPEAFGAQHTPKALEAVSNRAREPVAPDKFYQRLLTACWREAHRILKPGGMLAFTFHHSEDEPWVAVLESLFDAGFYLEATYPIRSDETKGEGSKPGTFGSQKIEYDIIHVCRKRTEEPTPVSWGRMRREVLADVRQLQSMLENHAKAGLPAADLQVIRRGKALEYFSRHYGKVYVDEGRSISVRQALIGVNQLIDDDFNRMNEPPPVTAEPITRQFLRLFNGKTELPRDQMQKLLRGSGITPDEFTTLGWVHEQKKVFHLVDPLSFARDWHGRHKRRLTSDLDQALVLIGACYDGSGINAADTLRNENFRPHAALRILLEWLGTRGSQPMRNGALRASQIYKAWAASNKDTVAQMRLFEAEDT